MTADASVMRCASCLFLIVTLHYIVPENTQASPTDFFEQLDIGEQGYEAKYMTWLREEESVFPLNHSLEHIMC